MFTALINSGRGVGTSPVKINKYMRVSNRSQSVPDQRKSPKKMTREGDATRYWRAAGLSLILHRLAPKRPARARRGRGGDSGELEGPPILSYSM